MISFNKTKEDLRCIWMSAGVVNYKLCERNFQCDQCEFHRVMSGLLPGKCNTADNEDNLLHNFPEGRTEFLQQTVQYYLHALFSDCKIHLDVCYLPSHLWCKSETKDSIRVGLDPLVLKILEPVDNIILPEKNEAFMKDQLMAWLIRKGKTIPIHSPVEGRVIEVNPQMHQANFRKIVMKDNYLFKMEGTDLSRQLRHSCDDMNGLHNYSRKVNILRKYLVNELQKQDCRNVGMTMADGGSIEIELEKVIGENGFRELLNELFYAR